MSSALPSKIRSANQTLLIERHDERIGDFFAPNYVAHQASGVLGGGHELIRQFLAQYWRAFPDLQFQLEILAEGADRIAWQRTLRATHLGAFKGFPASGRSLVWRDAVTSRFQDGLIVEEWPVSDLAEQLLLSRKGAPPKSRA
jgi:predicted ester cyclase